MHSELFQVNYFSSLVQSFIGLGWDLPKPFLVDVYFWMPDRGGPMNSCFCVG